MTGSSVSTELTSSIYLLVDNRKEQMVMQGLITKKGCWKVGLRIKGGSINYINYWMSKSMTQITHYITLLLDVSVYQEEIVR